MSTVARGVTGVLLMAYGSPNSLDEVLPYYTDVRGGHAPSADQLEIIHDHYARIGGNTGLLAVSEAQVAALQARLDSVTPGIYRVYLGMRHWHPFIADTVRHMVADHVREAVAIALAPQDSRISVGGYIASVEAAINTLAQERDAETGTSETTTPAIHFSFVRTWHDEPHFLRLLAERVAATREHAFSSTERDAVHMVFSAHSLPERVVTWNDPYPAELRATVAGVTQRLGLDESQWTFAYQSAGRTPEPWLGPSIQEVIPQLAARGVHAALVCPVGFVSDNLEILYDIDLECRDLAARHSMHLDRIAMPNADPLLIEALANVIQQAAHAGMETV